MSKEQRSNKEDKKKPALSPKEKKAAKKSQEKNLRSNHYAQSVDGSIKMYLSLSTFQHTSIMKDGKSSFSIKVGGLDQNGTVRLVVIPLNKPFCSLLYRHVRC